MKIGFATVDFSRTYQRADGTHPLGGAGHYRVGIIADHLDRHGHDVTLGVLVGNQRTGTFGVLPMTAMYVELAEEKASHIRWDCDLIVLQRWMHSDIAEDIYIARSNGQVIVNDVDDLFDKLPPTNHAYYLTDPRVNPDENRDHYRKILRASSCITVSTPYLADHYREFGVHVEVLRNAIDLERWIVHDHADPPRLGWVGATSFRAHDIEQISGVVQHLLGNGYAAQFHHSGHVEGWPTVAGKLGLDDSQVCTWPMAPIDDYPTLLDPIDVGVVPLEDHPFNYAKSCIKGMEYAAAGIPFVASGTPEYEWLAVKHDIGRCAGRPRSWRGHLHALTDPEVRKNEAAHNRAMVARLDIAHRWKEWETLYEGLIT